MTSSDKRPSVKGRKRAQGRFSHQEAAVVAAEGTATHDGLATPSAQSEASPVSAPVASDIESGNKASPARGGSKLLNRISSIRKGKDESPVDDMRDRPADDVPPSMPVRFADAPRREEPADFFDLGDFAEDASSAKKGPRRRAEAKTLRRGAGRSQAEDAPAQPPAGLSPASVTDAARLSRKPSQHLA